MITQYPDYTRLDPDARQSLGWGDLTADAWGVQKVSLPFSVFHGLWTFDIPATQWLMYEDDVEVSTSTNIISENSAAKLTSSATNADCLMVSRYTPRYQPNRGHLFSTAVWCPSKTADGIREWGLQTPENGVFFRLKADGKFKTNTFVAAYKLMFGIAW